MSWPEVDGYDVVRKTGPATWEAVEVALARRVTLHRVEDGPGFDADEWSAPSGHRSIYALVDGRRSDRYIVARYVAEPAPRRRRLSLLAATTLVVAALGAWFVARGQGPAAPAAVPETPAGATAYGSDLDAAGAATVDCLGNEPGLASPACTLLMAEVEGGAVVTTPGVVSQWIVRGAHGRVRLQVVIPFRDGFQATYTSEAVQVDDPSVPTVVAAHVAVPSGARFGLRLAPQAGIGVRHGEPSALTTRFLGPVGYGVSSLPTARLAGDELMLRVDVVPDP